MSDEQQDDVIRIVMPSGCRKVQVGNGPVIDIDVAVTWNLWCTRMEGRPPGGDASELAATFLVDIGAGRMGADFNRTETLMFIQHLQRLAAELRTELGLDGKPAEKAAAAPTG